MTPVMQTKFTDEAAGRIGNCFSACLASLLDISIEKVPPFEELQENRRRELQVLAFFVRLHGFVFVDRYRKQPPHDGQHYIAAMITPLSENIVHCVIMRDGKVVHNPNPNCPVDTVYGYYDIRPDIRKQFPR
jgi:hypothetical protein